MFQMVRDRLRRDLLLYVVFVTGAVVLAVEIMAVRILAPYFGNTIFTFSSVITVILAALSVGYWYGGRLADHCVDSKLFYKLVLASGVTVYFVRVISVSMLPLFSGFFSLVYGPLIASVFLFFVPSFLFGLLSPMVIRLRALALPDHGIGTLSGQVFFWSTTGSIFGSLLSGFVLIPHIGVGRSMVGAAIVVVCAGVLGLAIEHGRSTRRSQVLGVLVVLMMVWSFIDPARPPALMGGLVLFDQDGRYERIQVIEGEYQQTGARVLMLDRHFSSGITWPGADLLFSYTHYIDLYRFFHADAQNVAVLGAGTGTVAKTLHERYPSARVDMVDIEPMLFTLAHEYFAMPVTPQIVGHVADGRQFLRNADTTYDLIFGDMYSALYSAPWHVATREFYALVHERLADGGIYVGNYIGTGDFAHPSILGGTLRTIREIFEHVYLFEVQKRGATEIQNYIVVAVKGDQSAPLDMSALASSTDPVLRTYADHVVAYEADDLIDQPVFTDDRSTLELVVGSMIAQSSL